MKIKVFWVFRAVWKINGGIRQCRRNYHRSFVWRQKDCRRYSLFETRNIKNKKNKYSAIIYVLLKYFFRICNKILLLFVCSCFFFFNSSLIVFWFLFKCARNRWIKWFQHCQCITACCTMNLAFSGCLEKEINGKTSHVLLLRFYWAVICWFQNMISKRKLYFS